MTSSELLNKTQQQVQQFKQNRVSKKYPKDIESAVVQLLKTMSGLQIAIKLGVSKTFIYNCKKRSCEKNNTQNKKTTNKDIVLPILNITEDLKNIIKEEFSDTSVESVARSSFEKAAQVPVMKFTINKNIVIEIFSESEKDF